MTVTVKHSKTNAISDWTQAQLDEQIALGNFAEGTVLADIVLPSDWNNDHIFTGTLDVNNGGTGATTLTGYVKGSGTSALTASSTIPNTDISGLGTISTQNANSVAITGGSVNGTTIGSTTASTGRFSDITDTGLTSGRVTYASTGGNLVDSANLTFNGTTLTTTAVVTPSVTATTNNLTLSAISTGKINLNTATANQVQITDATAANGQYTLLSRDNTNNEQRISANASSGGVNFGISSAVAGAIKFYTNGFTELQAQVSRTASAVNYVQVTGAATGNRPAISAQGSDNPISLDINARGSAGTVRIGNALSTAFGIFQGVSGQTVVNYPTFIAGQTGFAIQTQATGTDTNISMAFQPKGTGAIDLAAGSSGVNISNGGTVTAITRTNTGTGYTSLPSIAVSAPTTAGGVTAVVTPNMYLITYSIVSGGTGYSVNDVLTVVGGTQTSAIQFTVTSVSAGVITGVSITTFGFYSALPTNPVSVTGGTGSSATFNLLTWGVSGFTISNAGSGYIEQPTVTFSGGGGSGASAYATVGSGTILRSLGNTMDLYAPSGIGFRIGDGGATTAGYWTAFPNTASPSLRAIGSSSGQIATGSAVPIQFLTNATSSSVEQMRVAHTASAVNYVQVTGGTTGNQATISAQGSDANVGLIYTSKGTSSLQFRTNNSSQTQLFITHTANAVNYASITGSAAGTAPAFSVAGTDTNIDLALTPKGTGLVRFGTYVAGALLATGYINIKAADGTTYKVLVST